jgi:hypothetical protein
MIRRFGISALTGLAVMFGTVAGIEASDLTPQVPKGKGEQCVADTDFMRRNHMHLLDHQRDDTVHEGIRTKRFSLKGCIECHAVNDQTGTPVTVKDERHFCRACHDFAAVKVDCFECHASRPDLQQSTGLPSDQKAAKALASYLKELGQ